MPSLWGDIEWGDGLWGGDDEIELGPFVDLGGNALSLPATAQAICGELETEVESTRIYDYHVKAVKDVDAAGSLLWKRLCAGPEALWAAIETRAERLTSLYNVDTIDDQYLRYLKLSAFWTADTERITDKLSASELRQLIAQSPELWDRRGVAGAYSEILNAIVGIDAFEIDWFDRRWVLDDTPLDADAFDYGIMILEEADRRFTDIHIEDAARALDRELIAEIVKLWRPSGERVQIVFAELFDRFTDATRSWAVSVGGDPATDATIANGEVEIPADSIVYTIAAHIEGKSDYMIRAAISPDSLGDYFGVAVRHLDTAPENTLEFRFEPTDLTLTIVQNGVQLAGTDVVDLEALGFNFVAGYAREFRVQIQRSGLLDFIAVWLDNEPVYSFTTNLAGATGTAGAIAGPSVSCAMSFFEMLPLPGETLTVGLGGAVTTSY